MMRYLSLFGALCLGVLTVHTVSCSAEEIPLGSGGGGESSVNSSSTAGPSTATGPACKPAGEACLAFSDCCSGACANQLCSACSVEGEACGTCCTGLTCYHGQCGSCADDGAPCQLASDCCSNTCVQGFCDPCGVVSDSCASDAECCTGNQCINGACCAGADQACAANSDCCDPQNTCQSGACKPAPFMCLTCSAFANAAFMGAPASGLCMGSQQIFDALFNCLCSGPCQTVCSTNMCIGQAASTPCFDCATDSAVGCGNQFSACVNDI